MSAIAGATTAGAHARGVAGLARGAGAAQATAAVVAADLAGALRSAHIDIHATGTSGVVTDAAAPVRRSGRGVSRSFCPGTALTAREGCDDNHQRNAGERNVKGLHDCLLPFTGNAREGENARSTVSARYVLSNPHLVPTALRPPSLVLTIRLDYPAKPKDWSRPASDLL